ncbi:MAG: anthrone oxygenase family protein [Pseudonocardia sp.]
MTTDALRSAALLAATLTAGLYAGQFYTFAVPVMPGLRQVDDRTFVDTMQQLNLAVETGWFMGVFLGAPLLAALAAALHLRSGRRQVLAWTAAGFALAAAAMVITVVVHAPLTTAINTAGDPDRITDLAGLRAGFEATWVRWNVARAVTATAAFACLIGAVVLDARTGSGSRTAARTIAR